MACMGACMVYFGVCLGENGGCPRPPLQPCPPPHAGTSGAAARAGRGRRKKEEKGRRKGKNTLVHSKRNRFASFLIQATYQGSRDTGDTHTTHFRKARAFV